MGSKMTFSEFSLLLEKRNAIESCFKIWSFKHVRNKGSVSCNNLKRDRPLTQQPIWTPNDIDALQFFRSVPILCFIGLFGVLGKVKYHNRPLRTNGKSVDRQRRTDGRYQTYYLPGFAVDNDNDCSPYWHAILRKIKQLEVGMSPPAFSFTLIVTLTFDLDLLQAFYSTKIQANFENEIAGR